MMNSIQPIDQLLDWRRQAVVDLVPRRPEGVAAAAVLGDVGDLEDGVVGGDALEGDAVMNIQHSS